MTSDHPMHHRKKLVEVAIPLEVNPAALSAPLEGLPGIKPWLPCTTASPMTWGGQNWLGPVDRVPS